LTRRSENRSNEDDDTDDRNKHIHQTILSTKKIDLQVIQKLNDTKENSKLFLFDRIKSINQKNSTCIEIRKVLLKNKKSYDEMLLKKFKSIENTLFFKNKL
jgi:hypothetical protein